ncbi:hypothetical protein N7454_005148 [Penicillium verhagenii]|nr:hypothetical protein N7454_005148 [Penicillium verhagenii]
MFRNNYDNDAVTLSDIPGGIRTRSSRRISGGGIGWKTHSVLVGLKVRSSHSIQPYYFASLTELTKTFITTIIAKCRRNLLLSEEGHRDRLAHGHCHCRALHQTLASSPTSCEAAIARFQDDLRPPNPADRTVSLRRSETMPRPTLQHYGKRPYGVGLLVGGVDESGSAPVRSSSPLELTHEMSDCAIGARSQMARTYLEQNLDKFMDCSRDELITHGLRALKETLSQDKELTIENTSVGCGWWAPARAPRQPY